MQFINCCVAYRTLKIMKKHLIGFMVAITIIVLATIISKTLFEIPNFFIGWISCTGYYTAKDLVE